MPPRIRPNLLFFSFLISITFTFLCPSPASAAPSITNITVSTIAEHGEAFAGTIPAEDGYAANFTVNWETDEPSTSRIVYGSTSATLNLSSRTDGLLKTKHSLRLESGIHSGRTYFYRVISRNASGEESQSSVSSIDIPADSEWWEVGHDSWMKRYSLADWSSDTDWIGQGNVYRKIITSAQAPTGGWIAIEQYPFKGPGLKLIVNGQQVGTWPYGYAVPVFDISEYLVTGTNTILVGQELGTGFTFQLLSEGEVSFADGSTISLNSTPSNWQKATISTSNWVDHPGPWSVPEIDFDSPFGSPYQKWLITGLPAGTPRRSTENHYSTSLARRNRLREGTMPDLLQNRTYLSADNNDKTLARETILQASDQLYSVEPLLGQAQPLIIAGNYPQAQTLLSQVDQLLDSSELKINVTRSFLDAASQFTALTLANSHINSPQVDTSLSSAASALASSKSDIATGNFTSAQTKLSGVLATLSSTQTTWENSSGYQVSRLNNSDRNALGFVRMRKASTYFNQFQQIASGNWLNLKNATNFAKTPADWKTEFRESLNFLSPFTLINISANSYAFGSVATHVAIPLSGGISIRPVSSNIYTRTIDGQLSANWLLAWNSASPNTPYIVVFQKNPDQIAYASSDLSLTRTGGVGDIVVYELYADNESINGDTTNIAGWSSALPVAVIADINFWSQALIKVPLNYVELQKDTGSSSEVITKYRYYDLSLSDDWNISPITISPLPQILSYARSLNYPGVTVNGTVRNTRYQTRSGTSSTWGPYELVEANALQISYPKFTDASYLQGVNSSLLGNSLNTVMDETSSLGFNSIRIRVENLTQGKEDGSEPNSFLLQSDFASTLTSFVDGANSKGLTAVVIVWNAVRTPSVLENNPANQAQFADSWRQIAQILSTKNVVYDLINEPSFTDVAKYNQLMDTTVQAIRSVDTTNPIAIEGFNTFARNFNGMTRPDYPRVWFEHHPYPNMYDQAYNTVDAYYPGFERGTVYADSDTYFEDFWQTLVRRKFQDPQLGLYSGEFGVQSSTQDTKLNLARDMADMNRRYGIHGTYFTVTGWTMFDLYAGSGDTKHVQADVVAALLGNAASQPTFTPTPTPDADFDNDGSVDIDDYNTLWDNFNKTICTFNLLGDCRINIFDYNYLISVFP